MCQHEKHDLKYVTSQVSQQESVPARCPRSFIMDRLMGHETKEREAKHSSAHARNDQGTRITGRHSLEQRHEVSRFLIVWTVYTLPRQNHG